MAKPLQEETNIIREYVRKKTQGKKEWVLIGNRDIPKLFNISQLYATKLLEVIKEDAHVLYEVDESFPTRFKPYRFKWADNEQEKIDHGLTAKQFYWLNDEEVEYIKTKTKFNTYEKMSKMIKLCNLLVGDGGKDWWIPLNLQDLADLTVSTTRDTERRIELLLQKQLIIRAEHQDLYRLVLDPNNLLEIKQEAKNDHVMAKPKQTRKKRKSSDNELSMGLVFTPKTFLEKKENFNRISENLGELSQERAEDHRPINRDVSPTQEISSRIESVTKSAQAMERTIANSLGQLQEQIKQLSELREGEEKTQRSYESFMKLSSEHVSTKEKLSNCETRIRQLENEVRLLCEYNDAFVTNAQIRMDVMLGTISGIVDEYVKRPKYEQNDEIVSSRLKKAIWTAVEDASEKITNYKPEDKFPPKEK
jgi:hypothetical protein